jgi:hypothetical protein
MASLAGSVTVKRSSPMVLCENIGMTHRSTTIAGTFFIFRCHPIELASECAKYTADLDSYVQVGNGSSLPFNMNIPFSAILFSLLLNHMTGVSLPNKLALDGCISAIR